MDKVTHAICNQPKSIHKRKKVIDTRKSFDNNTPVIVRKYLAEDGTVRKSIELDDAEFRRIKRWLNESKKQYMPMLP